MSANTMILEDNDAKHEKADFWSVLRDTPEKIIDFSDVNYFYFCDKKYPLASRFKSKKLKSIFSINFRNDRFFIIYNCLGQDAFEATELKAKLLSFSTVIVINFELTVIRESGNEELIHIFIPINTKLISEEQFTLPEVGEILPFEFHFVDSISKKLVKVINTIPSDFDFQLQLLSQIEQQRDMQFDNAKFVKEYMQFISRDQGIRPQSEIYSSDFNFIKQEPLLDELPRVK